MEETSNNKRRKTNVIQFNREKGLRIPKNRN